MVPIRSLAAVLLVAPIAPSMLGAQPRSRPTPTTATTVQAAYDSSAFRALQWRLIGPFRGGRANAVAGVTTNRSCTTSATPAAACGRRRTPARRGATSPTRSSAPGSIGAIAVAESDPNVIYVGTGEHAVRGQSSSYGDGVYKSPTPARRGRASASRPRSRSRPCACIRRIPISCTSRRRAIGGRGRPIAASTARPTAARRGRTCSRA